MTITVSLVSVILDENTSSNVCIVRCTSTLVFLCAFGRERCIGVAIASTIDGSSHITIGIDIDFYKMSRCWKSLG